MQFLDATHLRVDIPLVFGLVQCREVGSEHNAKVLFVVVHRCLRAWVACGRELLVADPSLQSCYGFLEGRHVGSVATAHEAWGAKGTARHERQMLLR